MTNNTVVVGVFDDRNAAEEAVDELEHSGFSKDDVGFAIRGADAVQGGMITDAEGTKDKHGALAGAATGAVAGGILGAIAAALIPGVGPVLSAGILTTALGFAGAGAAVGGILGAMTGLGVSQEEALYYEEQFRCGKAIVTVRAGDFADKALTIIRRHGGHNMGDRCPPGSGAAVTTDTVPPPSVAPLL
jgi:hypothetical protein